MNTKLATKDLRVPNEQIINGDLKLSKNSYEPNYPELQNMSAKGRKLSEDVLQILEHSVFPKKSKDNARTNIFEKKTDVVEAFVLGKVKDYSRADLVNSVDNIRFPLLTELLHNLIKEHNPSFSYTSIQINKGVKTSWHKDRGNRGMSYCLGLGHYKGGGVDVKLDNGKILHFDNKNKYLYYDGNYYEHSSSPVQSGLRFAIIFYTSRHSA